MDQDKEMEAMLKSILDESIKHLPLKIFKKVKQPYWVFMSFHLALTSDLFITILQGKLYDTNCKLTI